LILRKIKENDIEIFYNLIDKDIAKNLWMKWPITKKECKEIVLKWSKQWKEKKRFTFVIQLKKNKKSIGVMSIKKINTLHGLAELSGFVGREFRKSGYITEANIAINDFAFNGLGLRKLKSEVTSFNLKSQNIQKKFGMKLEGIMKKEWFNPTTKTYVTMYSFGLFKEDWKKISPKLKKELKEKIKRLEK